MTAPVFCPFYNSCCEDFTISFIFYSSNSKFNIKFIVLAPFCKNTANLFCKSEIIRPFSYMRREVEEERLSLLGWRSDKTICKVTVRLLQIHEVYWLLLDHLIVHQWDSYSAHITCPETLYIRRETGQILTGSLRKTHDRQTNNSNCSAKGDTFSFSSHHVVGVGDAQELVKALPGGKKCPVCPQPEVPLAHRSGGIA